MEWKQDIILKNKKKKNELHKQVYGKEKISMESKKIIMQDIFSKLSERNKNIMILIAKSIKITQETDSNSNNQ